MIYEVKNQSLKEKGTGYFYFNVSFPSKHKIPLSFEKRGCVQSEHMSLLDGELKGCWYMVLNIFSKFQ